MSNAPSFGKSTIILLIGAVVGFAGCTRQQADVPGPVCPDVSGVLWEIKLDVNGTQIVSDPYEVPVSVDNEDQVVWLWPGNPMREFTVSLQCDHKWHPPTAPSCEGTPDNGPPNPFLKPFTPPAGEVWTSDQGKICSGRAKRGAKGHTYKFTVQSPDLEPLDPHVRFY